MRTKQTEENYALCNSDGKILYVTPDMLGRIHRPLDGANLKDFLDPLDQTRLETFLMGYDSHITFTVRGIRGLGAVTVERAGERVGLMLRCYFACRQGDLAPETRGIRPELFRAAKRDLASARSTATALLSSDSTDGKQLGAAMDAMYRSSMLLLLTSEFFFGHSEDKQMRYMRPFLEAVIGCVSRWVRQVDIDIRLTCSDNLPVCYEDSSFAMLLMAYLSILNDVSVTHAVEVQARAALNGAYLTLRTESELPMPDFDLRPIGHVIPHLPAELQMRMHLCDVVGTTYGYTTTCAKKDGIFVFEVDMPHVRRGLQYLKADPFANWDTEGLCRTYFSYLFSGEEPR